MLPTSFEFLVNMSLTIFCLSSGKWLIFISCIQLSKLSLLAASTFLMPIAAILGVLSLYSNGMTAEVLFVVWTIVPFLELNGFGVGL